MILLALAEYRGVAVVRPVSADWVPYVDLHLQERYLLVALAAICASPALLPKIFEAEIKAVDSKIISWRRDFHQNPELSNREVRTSGIVAEHLKKLGLEVGDRYRENRRCGHCCPPANPGLPLHCAPTWMRSRSPSAPTCRSNRWAKSSYRGEEVGVMHACGHDSAHRHSHGVAEALTKVKGIAARQRAVRIPASRGGCSARRSRWRVRDAQGWHLREIQT